MGIQFTTCASGVSMNTAHDFIHRLRAYRDQLRGTFLTKSLVLAPVWLEAIYDHLIIGVEEWESLSPADHAKSIFCYGPYVGAVQCLWGSYDLAKSGLYLPAYGVLRSALEYQCVWEAY